MWIWGHRDGFGSERLIGCAVLLALGCGRIDVDPRALDAQTPIVIVDEATVALYTFDSDIGDQVVDAIGNNPGAIVGSLARINGPSAECATALSFAGDLSNHVLIDDAASRLWSEPGTT